MSPAIEVIHLTKTYKTNHSPAVADLNLTVETGEIFGLLGPNGAGKSTTLECILGTRKADSGTVSVLGLNPKSQRRKLYEEVGVQFQEGSYQDRITVKEICEETECLYKTYDDYRLLLEKFNLSHKLTSPVNELSGGERQRLSIILALIPRPKLVFLDELTTGLDTYARKEVWEILKELKKQGLTIFLTSHFMDEIEILCDRIGILKIGNLIFTGTVEEAKKVSGQESLENAYLWFTGELKEELEHESI